MLLGAEISFAYQNVDKYEFEADSLQISNHNKRVLSIDLDPQAHLTTSLGIDPDRTKHNTVFNHLTRLDIDLPLVVDRQGFDVIPSEINLIALQDKLNRNVLRTNSKNIFNRYHIYS